MGAAESARPERCYDPQDSRFTFVDEEDHLDFLYEGFSSRRARMSCGHAVTPVSLTNWCLMQLDQGKSRFVCGYPGCDAVWSVEEVAKMALLTPDEMEQCKKTMTLNASRNNCKAQTCPGCTSSVVREDECNLRVRCKTCTVKTGRSFDFCWQCLREWKGPRRRSDRCDNDDCHNPALRTLAVCPEMDMEGVRCPSVRACPTCGALVELNKINCRQVKCPQCEGRFCFVCLKLYYTCSMRCCGAAPRQTSLPVWTQMTRHSSFPM